MMHIPQEIPIADYDYELPDRRIAKYPLSARDCSKLLVYQGGIIKEARFHELAKFIPEGSSVIFNDTQVIQARLLFRKSTGALIEIFCLEPVEPADYAIAFQQRSQCSWKCLVGNLKKWKDGVLQLAVRICHEEVLLTAERKGSHSDSHLISFAWDNPRVTFAEILEAAGKLPIPPYLNRDTESSDLQTYQTVYAQIKGSVAAPTAGLHFTPEVLASLDEKGIKRDCITLHVGAGTFKPVKTETIGMHEMHSEFFTVRRQTIEHLLNQQGKVIAVGTTSTRTLESLYYIGVDLIKNENLSVNELAVKQWQPYEAGEGQFTPEEALQKILDFLLENEMNQLTAGTQLMIVPGYSFKIVQGMITNFHQPQSTLLLLVSAFVEGKWKEIYDYALSHDFRFLSYGDSSLLL